MKQKNFLSRIRIDKKNFNDCDIEAEIINFTIIRLLDIEKVLVSNKNSFGEETVSTLLVTCIMIIKLSHYIKCSLKQALM